MYVLNKETVNFARAKQCHTYTMYKFTVFIIQLCMVLVYVHVDTKYYAVVSTAKLYSTNYSLMCATPTTYRTISQSLAPFLCMCMYVHASVRVLCACTCVWHEKE